MTLITVAAAVVQRIKRPGSWSTRTITEALQVVPVSKRTNYCLNLAFPCTMTPRSLNDIEKNGRSVYSPERPV
jgi:hypothetical protein